MLVKINPTQGESKKIHYYWSGPRCWDVFCKSGWKHLLSLMFLLCWCPFCPWCQCGDSVLFAQHRAGVCAAGAQELSPKWMWSGKVCVGQVTKQRRKVAVHTKHHKNITNVNYMEFFGKSFKVCNLKQTKPQKWTKKPQPNYYPIQF